MKIRSMVILLSVLIVGCSGDKKVAKMNADFGTETNKTISTETVDGCQYVVAKMERTLTYGGNAISIVHKGNCPNHSTANR